MKVYTCTNFRGRWPVGTSAVVVAVDELAARMALESALHESGLKHKASDGELILEEVQMIAGSVRILQDGDY